MSKSTSSPPFASQKSKKKLTWNQVTDDSLESIWAIKNMLETQESPPSKGDRKIEERIFRSIVQNQSPSSHFRMTCFARSEKTFDEGLMVVAISGVAKRRRRKKPQTPQWLFKSCSSSLLAQRSWRSKRGLIKLSIFPGHIMHCEWGFVGRGKRGLGARAKWITAKLFRWKRRGLNSNWLAIGERGLPLKRGRDGGSSA